MARWDRGEVTTTATAVCGNPSAKLGKPSQLGFFDLVQRPLHDGPAALRRGRPQLPHEEAAGESDR